MSKSELFVDICEGILKRIPLVSAISCGFEMMQKKSENQLLHPSMMALVSIYINDNDIMLIEALEIDDENIHNELFEVPDIFHKRLKENSLDDKIVRLPIFGTVLVFYLQPEILADMKDYGRKLMERLEDTNAVPN